MPGACPGSVVASQGHDDPESEHAALGTAAHALAEQCLRQHEDAWEWVGGLVYNNSLYPNLLEASKDTASKSEITPVDKDMADAVQVYLNAVRSEYPDQNQGNTWIERSFHCPDIHELMWGRSDFVHLEDAEVLKGHKSDLYQRRLHVRDYKHGIGIEVEVRMNPQLMYYAAGILTDLMLWGEVTEVVLWVDQPRGFHHDGPTRKWTIRTVDLARWVDETLKPAFALAEELLRNNTDSAEELFSRGLIVQGEWCRFCPARFGACPALADTMNKLEEMMEQMKAAGSVGKLPNKEIGRFLTLFETAKIIQKATRETGYVRAQGGAAIPGWKLVIARKNRIWKDGVTAKAKKLFGKDALTTIELASPTTIDKLPGGKKFTAQYAEKPDGGMQLVPESDSRSEAGPKGRAAFKPIKKGRAKK